MSFGSVLILDHARDEAQRAGNMLDQEKWTSVLSFNLKTAERQLRSGRFRLMLIDAFTEGLNNSALDQLRSIGQNCPIAIMSGHSSYRGGTGVPPNCTGADFFVFKPFTPSELKHLLADTKAFHRAAAQERHVMVIENDVEQRRVTAQVLKEVGYRVSSVATFEDALFDHDMGMVDVVLTAILIPGMGGVEGTAQIKAEFGHIRVIAASQGVNDTITALHVLSAAKAAGADALLPKPYTMRDMLMTVREVLRQGMDAEQESLAQAAIDAILAR